MATLFIFSGLPGSGKTTLAQMLAQYTHSVFLRIDTVEQALRDLCGIKVEGEGYRLSYRIAADNLKLGMNVVADSCNLITITQNEWQEVALQVDAKYMNIEVICSDKTEHKKRIKNRVSTVPGLKLPSWKAIQNREYNPWESERIVIDTANKDINVAFEELLLKIQLF